MLLVNNGRPKAQEWAKKADHVYLQIVGGLDQRYAGPVFKG